MIEGLFVRGFTRTIKGSFSKTLKNYILNVRCYTSELEQIPTLVSCAELNSYLQKPTWHEKIRVLDSTWDLDNKDYRENHFLQRIGGSKFFSFEECRDQSSSYPRMLPSSNDFEDYVSELGIGNNHHVIVYDGHLKVGLYSAPRVWWMFRAFSHDKVSVLDGGFMSWILNGYPVETDGYKDYEQFPAPEKEFKAHFRQSFVKDFEFMERNAKSDEPVQVIDARGEQRYHDFHIPKSSPLPFVDVLDMETRLMKSKEDIRLVMNNRGVNSDKDIVSSCGSGITACITSLAVYHAEAKDVPIYDGSITEWVDRASEDMIATSNTD